MQTLALLVITATKAICLAVIKFLLASQLRGRSAPGPAEGWRGWRKGYHYTPVRCLLRGQDRINQVRSDIPLPHSFFPYHQTPLPFLHWKLRSWLFLHISWVPKVVLRPCGFQVTSMVLPWNSRNKSLSNKSLGVWVGKVRATPHTMKSIQPVLP